jgi:CheY-like chemotaxis protein
VLRMLEAEGFTILEASDGDGALALSDAEEAGAIDLLIADTVIPGPGGLELARRVRTRHPAIRTLVMSGYSEAIATPDLALEPGTEFIAKPFSRADLNVKLAALTTA